MPALGALGVNFNENLNWLKQSELECIKTKWVRGFIDMHQINIQQARQNANIKPLFNAIDTGYNTILSLKWNYSNLDFPKPGSPEHQSELQTLSRLLDMVMNHVDILVIGNEPFIEAKPDTDSRINVFYESLAEVVMTSRKVSPGPKTTRLFMGALNRLDLPANRTPAIERFLEYIASKPDLDGVDLHLHMAGLAGHQSMLDYALLRLRADQKFLVTEFSLVWHFRQHMADEVSREFCTKYGFPVRTKVCEILSAGIRSPMPLGQWVDFLRGEKWYNGVRGFILQAMEMYKATGRLEVATYGLSPMRHRKKGFDVGDTPWLLNGVFAPPTVRIGEDGERCENWPWAEEFRVIQGG
ncbi:uncharacterized protein N7477_004685 [Penicillium maclennaniae]|uniref:uncharacterized protein n=1 Tax=Penicillium maclennaniae TaxID=1343394 RepID=UPI0025402A51|nr:uncharacterized protein N7477_004685 [Penicillium maclennaniae]KAJ5674751.1 hypothetical protein N7477_004685 [Penicillium maclennaniae]